MSETPLAHNYNRSAFGIGFGFAQYFAGNWCCLAFTKENVFENVTDRMSFGPAEISVRNGFRVVANIKHESGDGIGNG